MSDTHAKVTFGIVAVSLDDMKKNYLEHFEKPGYPNIMFQQKIMLVMPLDEKDWELPFNIVSLFLLNSCHFFYILNNLYIQLNIYSNYKFH